MVQVAVSEFRGHLNKYLKAVEQGETLVLTSRNREVAKITAPDDKRTAAKQALGELRKTATVGDVLSSAGEVWKATK
jgi:prevent-host-death family protein